MDKGEELELVDVMTEGAAESSGCRTQLSSDWFSCPANDHDY